MAASVRQRLLNKARVANRPVAEPLQYYTMGMSKASYPSTVVEDLETAVAYLKSVGLSRNVDLVDLDLQKHVGQQLIASSEMRRVA